MADVLANLLGKLSFGWNGENTSIQAFVYGNMLASWMNPYFASLVYAVLFVLVNWVVARALYKRQIFIKI